MALLSILDWSLSEHQKVRMRGYLETVWIFLSYRDPRDLERLMLTTGGRFIVNSLSVFFAASLSGLFIRTLDVDEPEVLAIIGTPYWAGTTVGVILTLVYMHWLGNSSDVSKYKRRVDGVSGFAIFAWLGILFTLDSLRRVLADSLTFTFFAFLFALTFFTLSVGAIAGTAFYWRSIIVFLRGILLGVQFVVQRIVEYPKGPILGLGGLLMAIGALVKTFGP